MDFKTATPILRIYDIPKALEFYIDYLGFNLDWEHRFDAGMPAYFQVSKGDCVLHLSEHHGDGTPGTKIRVECTDIKSFHAQIKAKNYPFLNPGLNKFPWTKQEICLADPFGNHLIFFKS